MNAAEIQLALQKLNVLGRVLYLAAHPDHERARLASAPCQFDDEPLVIRRGAPDIGEHTDAILAEAGFDADQIRGLHDAGAVV